MKAPIPLPVKSINVRHIAPGDWTADITFGIPNDGAHDDPTITLNSGEGVELPPNVGDIMLVRPPEIVGYANYLMRNNFVLLVKIIIGHRFVALERVDCFTGVAFNQNVGL